jgi:hypothetical protein
MWMNDVEVDNVTIPKEIVADTAPTGLDTDGIHEYQDGMLILFFMFSLVLQKML